MQETPVTFEITTDLDFDVAVARCREALGTHGFGVLTEIDIQAALKKKLGVDRDPYLILGACHPPSAHRALQAMPEIGVLLPCNVTISSEGGRTVVRAMNPKGVLALVQNAEIGDVASEVAMALEKVLRSVASRSEAPP